MTAARDSTMTLVHRALAVRLEKEAKRHGLPDGWATVLIAASTSIKMLADAIDAHLATRDAVVSDESWRPVVSKVLTVLDIATGDTDPNIDPDMTDDEVRDEYPEMWAVQQLSLLLANQPESLASRKVAVPDGWIFYYADDEGTPYAHYCATRDDIYSQVGVWMCGEPDGGVLSDFGDDMLDGVTETLLEKGAFHPEGDPPCFLRKVMLASQDEVK